MVEIKIDENYRYENVELTSAKVNADRVTLKNNKVIRIDNARAYIGNDEFYFSVYEKGQGNLAYNVNNVSAGVDAMSIVNEFITFVENDIAPQA